MEGPITGIKKKKKFEASNRCNTWIEIGFSFTGL